MKRALADYQLAFEGQPLDVIKLADRASVSALAGLYKAAEADFEEALRRDPSNAWIRARRALYLHAARGDHKRAIADCDEALKLSPGHAEASLNRGLSLLALGDFRSAIADFDGRWTPARNSFMTFLGRFSSRYPELYRARSEARRRLGDLDGALGDLDAALGLNPERRRGPGPPRTPPRLPAGLRSGHRRLRPGHRPRPRRRRRLQRPRRRPRCRR